MPLLSGLIPLLGILLKMLIVRIILATGLTFVTYAGYLAALEKFKGYTSNAINSMPSDILNLLLISGFGQGLGCLFRRILVLHWYARIQKTDVCLSGMR
ncbi:phage associated protein [Neisseria gonorrhoeae]|nr:phage associated protein [Neisseria gonorrhoeae]